MTFRLSGTRFASQTRLALVLLSLAAIAGLSAAHAQTAAPESPEGVNGNHASGNSYFPPLARDKFDPVQFMNAFASHYYLHPENPSVPQFVFFPPVPPPLESEIPVLAPYDPGPPAPAELEAFVGDTFYRCLEPGLLRAISQGRCGSESWPTGSQRSGSRRRYARRSLA